MPEMFDKDTPIGVILGSLALVLLWSGGDFLRTWVQSRSRAAPDPDDVAWERMVSRMESQYASLQARHDALSDRLVEMQDSLQAASAKAEKMLAEARRDASEIRDYTVQVIDYYENGGKPPTPQAPTRIAHHFKAP